MTDKKDRTGAADLGLDLRGGSGRGDDASLFTWLVPCLLLGARINQERAAGVHPALQEFKGIGPVAADIFLRDAPAVWHP